MYYIYNYPKVGKLYKSIPKTKFYQLPDSNPLFSAFSKQQTRWSKRLDTTICLA